MAIIQSDHVKGIKDVPYPAVAGMVCAARFAMTVPASAAAGDIFELAVVPAGCRVLDLVLDADALDSNGSPTLTLDVGIMSGESGDPSQSRTCGAEFFSASTVGRAGGVAMPTLKTAYRTTKSNVAKSIGVKINAAAATAAAGNVGLTVRYAAE